MKIFISQGPEVDPDIEKKAIQIARDIYQYEHGNFTTYVFNPNENRELVSSIYYAAILLEELVTSDLVYFGNKWNKFMILQILHKGACEMCKPILHD